MKFDFFKHETKRHITFRFLGVFLLVIAYFIYASLRFGAGHGFLVTILTWSFFVFCTPVADAGMFLDLPIRLLIKIRMLHSEVFVWIIAAIVNLIALISFKGVYQSTFLLQIFYNILTHPFPYGLIILLSAAGTFLSVYFGDELIDKVKHKDRKNFHKHKWKYRWIVIAFILVAIILLYYMLIHLMGIKF